MRRICIYLDNESAGVYEKIFNKEKNNGFSNWVRKKLKEKYEKEISIADLKNKEREMSEKQEKIKKKIENREKEIKDLSNFTKEEHKFLIESKKAIEINRNVLTIRKDNYCKLFKKRSFSDSVFLDLINEAMKYGVH